jgi:hypothetical protein
VHSRAMRQTWNLCVKQLDADIWITMQQGCNGKVEDDEKVMDKTKVSND